MKSKNFTVFNLNSDDDLIFKDFRESGKSIQKYFTEVCLQALNEEFEVKENIDAYDYENLQFRVENTLHTLLKEKSKAANRTMESIVKMTALRAIKKRSQQ